MMTGSSVGEVEGGEGVALLRRWGGGGGGSGRGEVRWGGGGGACGKKKGGFCDWNFPSCLPASTVGTPYAQ